MMSKTSDNTRYTASLRYAQIPYGTSYIWDALVAMLKFNKTTGEMQ